MKTVIMQGFVEFRVVQLQWRTRKFYWKMRSKLGTGGCFWSQQPVRDSTLTSENSADLKHVVAFICHILPAVCAH